MILMKIKASSWNLFQEEAFLVINRYLWHKYAINMLKALTK